MATIRAAPLKVNGRDAGYVYIVLFGEERDSLAAHLSADSVLRSTLWSMGLVTLLGLLAGLAAFHLITRPLRQLTEAVRHLQADGLTAQQQQPSELFANISHDLRTPLTSLHGYLETLLVKADMLAEVERRRYLEIALGQSAKVGRLAQELFELARLEYGAASWRWNASRWPIWCRTFFRSSSWRRRREASGW